MRATVAPGALQAQRKALRVERCSPDERSDIRGKTDPHIAALMRATVAPGRRRRSEEALRVDRCSPDERSDIREGLPRISLRSCGLLAVTMERAFTLSRRDAPGFCKSFAPNNEGASDPKRDAARPSSEGAGNAGCTVHPQSVCNR